MGDLFLIIGHLFKNKWFTTFWLVSSLQLCYCQNNYCDSSTYNLANNYYNEAIATNYYHKPGAISLLKKAIKTDTAFAKAYFTLGEIYHKKALLSQYDIKNQIHHNYYFRKASDNFLYSIELCEELNNYKAFFYLGEQFYLQKEYSLASHYLDTFIEKNKNTGLNLDKAKLYYNNYLRWKYWQESPYNITYQCASTINTSQNELNPYISANGQIIYFLSQRKQLQSNSIYYEDVSKFTFSKVGGLDSLENWIFTHVEVLPVSPIKDYKLQYISNFNSQIILSNCKKVRTNNMYVNHGNMYVLNCSNNEFSTPQVLKTNMNSPSTYIGQPCISNDGNTIYFTSDHPDGYGGTDIYYMKKDSLGNWCDPINMGDKINTMNNEAEPFIHYDDLTFYFVSDGHFGLGGSDLFISRKKNSAEQWSEPVNLGIPINSPADEKGVSIDARGIKAYTCSNKKIGKGGWDIFSFDLPLEFRPNEMILLGGKIIDQDSIPVIVQDVEIIDLKTNDFYSIEFDKLSGSFSSIIPMQQTNYYIKVKATGYSFGNTIIEGENSAHTYYETITLNILSKGNMFYLKHLHFHENLSFHLQSIQILADFARYLKENTEINVNIIGANTNGNMVKNTPLLTNKAKKTYTYLVSKGIHASRLQFKKDTGLISNIPKTNPTHSEIIIEITEY